MQDVQDPQGGQDTDESTPPATEVSTDLRVPQQRRLAAAGAGERVDTDRGQLGHRPHSDYWDLRLAAWVHGSDED